MVFLAKHTGVNQDRADVFAANKFLDRSDVVPRFEEVRGGGKSESVAAETVDHFGLADRIPCILLC
jgi:hypothetical protein